ncbi:hypothetical protein O0544_20380 [Edwardsiella anguillarum]|nr:hypothetical protein [Edwardsiella anguillarum]
MAVDAFINETSALADYLVPDTVTYESWGSPGSGKECRRGRRRCAGRR